MSRHDCTPDIRVCVNNVLFGARTGNDGCPDIEVDGCLSPIISVTDKPILIRGFDIAAGEKMNVIMLSDDMNYSAVVKKGCGCCLQLSAKNNQLILTIPGKYRLDRCVCPAGTTEPVSDSYVEWVYIPTHMAIGV